MIRAFNGSVCDGGEVRGGEDEAGISRDRSMQVFGVNKRGEGKRGERLGKGGEDGGIGEVRGR